jgi:putative ABC transport system ATP-binding protein
MSSDIKGEPIIVCKNIQKYYGNGPDRVEALKGVNLTINRGELRLLMGPSGSGKTTLISIIAGILTQSDGECLINNVHLNELREKEKTAFRGKQIGFVFQIFNLIPMITVEENVAIPLLLHKVDRKEAFQRAREIVAELGMADKFNALPSQLSGGQQQRVAIARALVHNPQIIVCDEPTSFLDHVTGNKIMTLLQDMVKKKNLTCIVVTHDPRIIPFADQIDHLEDGRIMTTA